MAVTIRQTEAAPEDYPDFPLILSPEAAALDKAMLWQRLEAYVSYRWSERDVSWIVEGPGEWVPPLVPAEITAVEIWDTVFDWAAVQLSPSPLGGYSLPGCGPYRFMAVVAGGSPAPDVPEAVLEAFRRLAEYMAQKPSVAGARNERFEIANLSKSTSRSPSWLAEAIQNSGAADLLRPYRRVA